MRKISEIAESNCRDITCDFCRDGTRTTEEKWKAGMICSDPILKYLNLRQLIIDNIKELQKEIENIETKEIVCPTCGIRRLPSGDSFQCLDVILIKHTQIKILKEIFEISDAEIKASEYIENIIRETEKEFIEPKFAEKIEAKFIDEEDLK